MGEIRGVATAETLAVQMEGDSRRLPRLAGGHPNLWPQPVQSSIFLTLWICLAPPPSPSQSLLHPRENFLKNVHNQRSRLGCRVASFSRWKLALASSHPQSKIASSCLYSKWTIPFLFLQSVDKSMSIDKEPALTTAKEKILSKIANSWKFYDWRMPLKTGGGPTVTENSWSYGRVPRRQLQISDKKVKHSPSTTTLDLLQLSLHLFAIIHNCQGHLQDLKVSKGSKQPSGAIRPSRGTILWLLCAIFFLVLKLTSTYKGRTTNLNSWYWGMECNRVKFPNSGIAIALEFREGQFNIRPGVETFTAISRMFYLL